MTPAIATPTLTTRSAQPPIEAAACTASQAATMMLLFGVGLANCD